MMTTFDEFVEIVRSQLSVHHPKDHISLETISTVLSQAGVASAFEQEISMPPCRKLQVRRVYISGHKSKSINSQEEYVPFNYDRRFGPGLNGWVAGNGTGKSTILKAIVWGLTGAEQLFKQDIRAWIEDVALEIAIEDAIYTLRYFLRAERPRVHGYIAEHDLSFVMQNEALLVPLVTFTGQKDMTEKIDLFFTERLQFLSPLDLQSPEGIQKRVPWQTYALAFFLGSNYTDYLFPQNGLLLDKLHQRTLGAYLGIISTDILATLEFKLSQARDAYNFESKRVTLNAMEAQNRIRELEVELQSAEKRIQMFDNGQSIFIDPTYRSHVQEQVAQHTRQLVELSHCEQQLSEEERELKKTISESQRACQGLREAIEFKVFFSGISIERCPNCEHKIPIEDIEEEIYTKHCRLCHSELHPVQSVAQYELMLKEQQEELKLLEKQLKKLKKEWKRVEQERQEEDKQVTYWESELQDISRQEQAGFTQEMRNHIERYGRLQGQLQQLQGQTMEVRSENLQQLEYTVEILEAAGTQMQARLWQRYAAHWNMLQKHTAEFAKLFGIPDLGLISFQFKEHFDLCVKQGGKLIRYRDMEASEMLRLKLAFHLALLVVSTTSEIGRHPGILIIDAPGGAEMDEQHFQRILKGFSRCKDQIDKEFQILIASTKESIASVCEPAQVEKLNGATTFF